MVAAEGREHPTHTSNQAKDSDTGSFSSSLPHPNDLTATVRYREEYAYDGVGNIFSVTHRASAGGTIHWNRLYQYATTSNKLTGTSDTGDTPDVVYADTTSYTDSYTHDARGNMTFMPHLPEMDWDFGDRLQHASRGTNDDSYFNYDAAGNRVRKVWEHTGLVDHRIYVGGYELWRRYPAALSPTRNRRWG